VAWTKLRTIKLINFRCQNGPYPSPAMR